MRGDGAMRRAVESGLANHDGAGRKTLEKPTAKLTERRPVGTGGKRKTRPERGNKRVTRGVFLHSRFLIKRQTRRSDYRTD